MSIERLRALEKAVELVAKATPGPWTDEDNRTWVTPLPEVRSGDVKVAKLIGDDFQVTCTVGKYERECANASAIAAAVNFIREHGSALIAELGQEVGAVAPVAMRIVLPRGSTTGWESYDAERAANLSKGWTVELAYSSPAHTSEARDAELLEAAKVMRYLLAHIDNEFPSGWGWERLDNALSDAAMRQEGGSDA